MQQKLSPFLRTQLDLGNVISADVVTLSCNYLSIPHIPLSDYVAAIEVQPMQDGTYRIIYREIPEELLKYEFEWDRYATINVENVVGTIEEVEQFLSRYITDFSLLVAGSNMYASA